MEVIEELAKGGLARLPFGGIAQAQIPKPMLLPRNYAPIVVPKTPPFSPCQVPDCQPSKILVSGVSQTTNAIECFLRLTFLACNLFHAFFALNLKAAARNDKSQVLWARLMTAEFLHEMAALPRSPWPPLPPSVGPPCSVPPPDLPFSFR